VTTRKYEHDEQLQSMDVEGLTAADVMAEADHEDGRYREPDDAAVDNAIDALATPSEQADDPSPAAPAAPSITFSPQQDAAMAAVRDWLTTRSSPVFRLFGFAGTGKTTMAKSLAEQVDGYVAFAAFTGKAASVMKRKGCRGASTIHRLIYKPIDEDEKKLAETRERLRECTDPIERAALRAKLDELLKPQFERGTNDLRRAKLVVIDECSMVDERIGKDLLEFKVPVLVLGDPAQLPPVGGGGFFTEAEPDILLDEIHRQAEGSGILQLATTVRQRRTTRLVEGIYGDEQSAVLSTVAVERLGNPLAFDQILVGTHKTRRIWNARMRKLLNRVDENGQHTPLPVPGEKLVCMKNVHGTPIMNGTLWTCRETLVIDKDRLQLTVESEDTPGNLRTVDAVRHFFEGRDDDLKLNPVRGAQFDFGYALTVHKAQGSSWPRVLLINEANAFRRQESPDTPWRWLYTGITRASETVVVAQ
jgi:ATP-dependent exoDNAse (exonuclease V) alpha subunit